TRGNDRDAHDVGYGAGQCDIVARQRAITVHAGQQDLARTQIFHLPRPGNRVHTRRQATATHVHLPRRKRPLPPPGVDGDDDSLAAEFLCPFSDQLTVSHRGRVDTHLVGPGTEYRSHIRDGSDTPTDREWDEHTVGHSTGHSHDSAAVFVGGGDIEKDKLIRAFRVVIPGLLHRVAGVAEFNKVDTLDNPPVFNIQTGYDPFRQHRLNLRPPGIMQGPVPLDLHTGRGR